MRVTIIGAGLAGCEAAWQITRAGGRAILYEMRPARSTQAHKTDRLAELVCSNSLKSEQENTAPWLLKEELRRLGSLLIGEIAPVTITDLGRNSLFGTLIREPAIDPVMASVGA